MKAKATEAKEEMVKENVTTADQPGISRVSTLDHARANARAKDFSENATTAEKLDLPPVSAPTAKEMKVNLENGRIHRSLERRRIHRSLERRKSQRKGLRNMAR